MGNSTVQEILRGHPALSHPFSLAVFESSVYWADWRAGAIVRANKWNGSGVEVLQQTQGKPFGLVAVHPVLQPQVQLIIAKQLDNFSISACCWSPLQPE